MVHGARSCSAARRRRAKPRRTGRVVVERQRQTSSYRTRSAACGQPGLCASGTGGEWEQHLAARSGVQDQHGEHRQDGAEAHQPSQHHWQPQLLTLQRHRWMVAAAQPRGPSHGCALQRQRSPMAVRNASSSRSFRLRSRQPSLWNPGWREGPRARFLRIAISERFVAVSCEPLVELP